MTIAISVENVSKEYRLGAINHGTLSHDLQSWWARMRGKEDPNAPIHAGAFNARGAAHDNERFLALDDISFQVQQGDVLGVIGNNGAGKSTLLKILSQVTAPTRGTVRINGRIASLLEVGTGFHPELTGRENVFLNGAILGMRHAEIQKKFDEIVAFAEIEKFIDTPVKRYSSGMYVRLAFAVAAHLEPEILILDEVLAVGDAQFQKKCLGKMKETGSQGRTVIFVSHNLAAVKSLCNNAISLASGQIVRAGPVAAVVDEYLGQGYLNTSEQVWPDDATAPGNPSIKVHKIKVSARDSATSTLTIGMALQLEFVYSLLLEEASFYVGVHFKTVSGEIVFVSGQPPQKIRRGTYSSVCQIPGNLLNTGIYTLHIYFVRDGSNVLLEMESPVAFEIQDEPRLEGAWMGDIPGAVRPKLDWTLTRV
jgi:lipopolysaccharide transport system ATP-binding protein